MDSLENFLGDINKPKEVALKQAKLLLKLSEKTGDLIRNCKDQHTIAALTNIEVNLILAAGYNTAIGSDNRKIGDPRITDSLAIIKGQISTIRNFSIAESQTEEAKIAASDTLNDLNILMKDIGLDKAERLDIPMSFDHIMNKIILATTSAGLDSKTTNLAPKTNELPKSEYKPIIGFGGTRKNDENKSFVDSLNKEQKITPTQIT